jgi:hypothetical protein
MPYVKLNLKMFIKQQNLLQFQFINLIMTLQFFYYFYISLDYFNVNFN